MQLLEIHGKKGRLLIDPNEWEHWKAQGYSKAKQKQKEPEPVDPTPEIQKERMKELMKKTVPELDELIEELGIKANDEWKKAEKAAAIVKAEAAK